MSRARRGRIPSLYPYDEQAPPKSTRRRALVGALLLTASTGCGLLGELPPQITRLTSPDRQTDLVLTWRGGGGAAGWTKEEIALVAHGRGVADDDHLATIDPETLLGARWRSNDLVEIGLRGQPYSGPLPRSVRVGGKVIALRVRDSAPCRRSHRGGVLGELIEALRAQAKRARKPSRCFRP